jgi:hypothetical protein
MSAFDVHRSLDRFDELLGKRGAGRRRADAGSVRVAPEVEGVLRELLSTHERPNLREVRVALVARCRRMGRTAPSRATIYQFMARVRTPELCVGDLPRAVCEALYHFEADSLVPEAQVAFCCFNYGGVAAMSFAAGLPWLALWQAARMRGWRPRSRGALEAVITVRRI